MEWGWGGQRTEVHSIIVIPLVIFRPGRLLGRGTMEVSLRHFNREGDFEGGGNPKNSHRVELVKEIFKLLER